MWPEVGLRIYVQEEVQETRLGAPRPINVISRQNLVTNSFLFFISRNFYFLAVQRRRSPICREKDGCESNVLLHPISTAMLIPLQ